MALVETTEPMYPALAAPPPPARPRVLLVGTLLGAAALVMTYVGILGVYLALRADAEGAWLPDNVTIPLSPPTMMTVTLLLSVVALHWAQASLRNDDRINAYVALGLTLLLGLAFINSAVYLFTQMGAAIAASTAELLLFVIGGFHIASIILGLVFVALMAFRTLGGQYSGRDNEGLSAAVVLWDAAVVCYLVSWYAVYITK